MITNEKAIEILENQRTLLKHYIEKRRMRVDFQEWKRNTRVDIEQIFSSERHLKDFDKISFFPPGIILQEQRTVTDDWESFSHGLYSMDALLRSYIREIKNYRNDHPSEPKLDVLQDIERICDRFPEVVQQLLLRYNKRATLVITDEYDVQDLFHALLYLYFNDVRSEEWNPSYAGGASRSDFVLPQEKIVIEIKKTRENLADKKLGEELIIDIARYNTQPDCKLLIAFIYDPERRIKNAGGLKHDLTREHNGLPVKLIIKN